MEWLAAALVRLFSNNMRDRVVIQSQNDPIMHVHARLLTSHPSNDLSRAKRSHNMPTGRRSHTLLRTHTHTRTPTSTHKTHHIRYENGLSTHFMFMFIPDTRLCSIASSLLQQIENNAEIDKSECWALRLKSSRYIRGMQRWYICDPLIFCRNTDHTFDPPPPTQSKLAYSTVQSNLEKHAKQSSEVFHLPVGWTGAAIRQSKKTALIRNIEIFSILLIRLEG